MTDDSTLDDKEGTKDDSTLDDKVIDDSEKGGTNDESTLEDDEVTDNSLCLGSVQVQQRQGRKRKMITSVPVPPAKQQTRTSSNYVGQWSKDLNSTILYINLFFFFSLGNFKHFFYRLHLITDKSTYGAMRCYTIYHKNKLIFHYLKTRHCTYYTTYVASYDHHL